LGQDGIDLDGDDMPGAGQQRLCQRAAAGSDFNRDGSIVRAGGGRDAIQRRLTNEEMLTEPAAH
jgi:hypothetical protein